LKLRYVKDKQTIHKYRIPSKKHKDFLRPLVDVLLKNIDRRVYLKETKYREHFESLMYNLYFRYQRYERYLSINEDRVDVKYKPSKYLFVPLCPIEYSKFNPHSDLCEEVNFFYSFSAIKEFLKVVKKLNIAKVYKGNLFSITRIEMNPIHEWKLKKSVPKLEDYLNIIISLRQIFYKIGKGKQFSSENYNYEQRKKELSKRGAYLKDKSLIMSSKKPGDTFQYRYHGKKDLNERPSITSLRIDKEIFDEINQINQALPENLRDVCHTLEFLEKHKMISEDFIVHFLIYQKR